jgi:KDO2-lipid IV(A) lauroyltransferase
MQARLISTVARLLSLLPLPVNHLIGTLFGTLAWISNSRSRRVTEFNLQHCMPEKPEAERRAMAIASLRHTGRLITECAWIWHRPIDVTAKLLHETVNEQIYIDAVASPHGVIMVTPHIGNWEVIAIPLARQSAFTYFYRSPRNKVMDALLLRWRAHLGGQAATLDAKGIRNGLRILKNGGVVGILPDQEPDQAHGVFAPFFDQPALTMTLLSRLAARSNAQVIFVIAERLTTATGWRIHFFNAEDAIADPDPVVAASALNRDVQRCIDICPEQYLWDYKRFNTKTDGSRRNY